MSEPRSAVLADRAVELADDILGLARRKTDGSLTWDRGFALDFTPAEEAGVFNGRIGEALLFAAVARARDDSRFADAAAEVLAPLRRQLKSRTAVRSFAREIGLGVSGLGSIVYALARIGDYLDSDILRAEARDIALAVDDSTLQSAVHLDVCWGLAGWILGLLAIGGRTDDVVIGRALNGANLLLNRRVLDPRTARLVWPSPASGPPTAGFAHGNTGIGYSVLRLYAVTRLPLLRESAIDVSEFERALFRKDLNEWPDTEEQDYPLRCAWCHGAPGIILARLAALKHLDVRDHGLLTTDLRLAIHRTLSMAGRGLDTLCCGSFGRIDCLLEAALQLPNASLNDSVYDILDVLVRAYHPDMYRLTPSKQLHMSGGLWQGLTGVAFGLLRFSDPISHPSVLTLSRHSVQ